MNKYISRYFILFIFLLAISPLYGCSNGNIVKEVQKITYEKTLDSSRVKLDFHTKQIDIYEDINKKSKDIIMNIVENSDDVKAISEEYFQKYGVSLNNIIWDSITKDSAISSVQYYPSVNETNNSIIENICFVKMSGTDKYNLFCFIIVFNSELEVIGLNIYAGNYYA